jgi:hypothetical protein
MNTEKSNMVVGNVPAELRRRFVGTCHIQGVPAREILISLMEQWLDKQDKLDIKTSTGGVIHGPPPGAGPHRRPTPPVAPLIRKLIRGA